MLCQMKPVPWRNTQPRHCVSYWLITWIWTNLMPFWTDPFLTLQRHLRVLTKFAHVESRLSGRKRHREVVFYTPVNLCARRACSTSVAVGVESYFAVYDSV